jgi:hypothetical protein
MKGVDTFLYLGDHSTISKKVANKNAKVLPPQGRFAEQLGVKTLTAYQKQPSPFEG